MNTTNTIIRNTVHSARRARGIVKVDRTYPYDDPTALAVLRGIRRALRTGPNLPDETVSLDRIESIRKLALKDLTPMGDRTLARATDVSMAPRWAWLLHNIVREVKPEGVLEMGSSAGFTAYYLAQALHNNGKGQLITMDGNEDLVEYVKENFERLGYSGFANVIPGRFDDTIDFTLRNFLGAVDFAFIDGNHHEGPTLDYMERVIAKAGKGRCVLVFDDIRWVSKIPGTDPYGMHKAWTQIKQDKRFTLTIDMGDIGIAVMSDRAAKHVETTIAYG